MKWLILFSGLVLALFGCGKEAVYNQPGAETGGFYETAWIDPKVVVDDPWYTLMRSSRVDSFFVDTPPDNSASSGRSIKMFVTSYECLATVNIIRGNSEVVRPLIAKNLGPGFYKLTLNMGEFAKEKLPPGDYFLRAEFCGKTVIQELGWR